MASPMIRTSQPVLTKDYREFIPEPPSVITDGSWVERDRLADKHYPHIYDLLAFPEDRLIDILLDVEEDKKPDPYFPVGAVGSRVPLAWLPRRSWLEWHLFRGIAPDARRPGISPALRDFVIKRDGYVCGICGGEVEPGDVHLDHIKPFSKGGPTSVSNLQVAHSLCNMRKGAKG